MYINHKYFRMDILIWGQNGKCISNICMGHCLTMNILLSTITARFQWFEGCFFIKTLGSKYSTKTWTSYLISRREKIFRVACSLSHDICLSGPTYTWVSPKWQFRWQVTYITPTPSPRLIPIHARRSNAMTSKWHSHNSGVPHRTYLYTC